MALAGIVTVGDISEELEQVPASVELCGGTLRRHSSRRSEQGERSEEHGQDEATGQVDRVSQLRKWVAVCCGRGAIAMAG